MTAPRILWHFLTVAASIGAMGCVLADRPMEAFAAGAAAVAFFSLAEWRE